MKKKSFKKALVILCLAMGGVFSVAQTNLSIDTISLEVHWFDPTDTGGHPRTPVARPSVAQDGHTLYFNILVSAKTLALSHAYAYVRN